MDPTVHDPKTLRVAGNREVTPENMLFQTHFTDDVWHNFAVTLGWTSKYDISSEMRMLRFANRILLV